MGSCLEKYPVFHMGLYRTAYRFVSIPPGVSGHNLNGGRFTSLFDLLWTYWAQQE